MAHHYSRIVEVPMGFDWSRFDAKVEKTATCHQWVGAKYHHGYGRAYWRRKPIMAHRLAYLRVHGTIQDGMVIDHLCRNPLCVNPDHLEAVTQGTNTRRGHPWPESQTVTGRLRPTCRLCANERARQRRGEVYTQA